MNIHENTHKYTVYSIQDGTGKIVYVGVTRQDIKDRLDCHKTSNTPIGNIIRSNKNYTIEPLDEIFSTKGSTCPPKDVYELERYWLWQVRSWGFNLINTHHFHFKHHKVIKLKQRRCFGYRKVRLANSYLSKMQEH